MRQFRLKATWIPSGIIVCWTVTRSIGTTIKAKPHLHGLNVAIVGGGVAGLASAVSLRKIAGVNATVFEARPGSGHGGFGLALWPNGLRALHHIDVSLHDEVVRSGSVITERLHSTIDATDVDYCRERESFGHPMVCVRSLSLYNALRRAALHHGCEIVSGTACKDILPAPSRDHSEKRANLIFSSQEEAAEHGDIVPADFVVGADGLNSVVRARYGDTTQPRDTECVWFFGVVANAACPTMPLTRVQTFGLGDPDKAASLMPVGDHTYWAVALSGPHRHEAMDFDGGHKEMKRFLRKKLGGLHAMMTFVDSTPPHQIHRRRIEDRPAVNSFVSGVTSGDFYSALVGDAAHPSRPSVGQGANMALEDAVQLALLLRDTDSIKEALTEYDAARVLRCATLQGDSEFVASRLARRPNAGWRKCHFDRQEHGRVSAKTDVANAEFVCNWQPVGLRHFPWVEPVLSMPMGST